MLEKGFNRELGFDVAANTDLRKDAFWFGEAQSRVVVSCNQEQVEQIRQRAASANIPVTILGTVTGGYIKVNGESWNNTLSWKEKYNTAIENILNA